MDRLLWAAGLAALLVLSACPEEDTGPGSTDTVVPDANVDGAVGDGGFNCNVCDRVGEILCEPAASAIRTCEVGANGCLRWGEPTSCDDGDPCTSDLCDTTGCTAPIPHQGPCDDGDITTTGDVCDAAGVCAGTGYTCPVTQCVSDSTPNGVDCDEVFKPAGDACDDGDAATNNDVCDGAGGCSGEVIGCSPTQCEASAEPNGVDCTITNKPAGDSCDDGDPATNSDVCDGNGACAGTPYACEPGNCEATSEPNGVDCDITLADEGTTCDDGDAGTAEDVCDDAGGCAGTPYACEVGVCQASSTPNGVDCDIVFSAVGTACDDGDVTTGNDVCDGTGGCAGEAIVCTPGLCEDASDPNGVDCTPTYSAAGTGCDDGNLSTNNDVCDGSGACAGTDYTCTPTQCQESSEPNGTDCDITLKLAGEACDDGDDATKDDICDGADGCAGTVIGCVPTQCEETSTPNGVDCDITYKGSGAACDDGDPATNNDVCDGSGGCGGTPYTCTPGVCEATSVVNGVDCTVTFEPSGTACDDGNDGTNNDLCDANGGCLGTPYACAPGICEASSTPNGTDCTVVFSSSGTGCDDGNVGTNNDVCDGSGGCLGTPYACAPGVCEDSSTPNGTDCDVVFSSAGTGCDDGNAGTNNDQCNGNGGCIGTPFACAPGVCEASSTPNGTDCDVVFSPSGTGCDDGNAGTNNDQCNGSGGCIGTPYACAPGVCEASSTPNGTDCDVVFSSAGTGCDDGNAGTNNDQCNGNGGCIGTPYACAPGVCEASSTPNGTDCDVVFSPSGTGCDDGNAGTNNDQCNGSGGCIGTPYACAPGVCEASSTPNGTDCDVVFSPSGTGCNDGNSGTNNDQCNGSGGCIGTPYNCSPGVCEASSTPNGTGCDVVFSNSGTPCNDGNNSTNNDQCNGSGTCAGTPYTCTPTQCQQSSTPNGTNCTVVNQPNGTLCGSQNPCNSATTCQNGTCVPGSPNSCGNGTCQASCGENTSSCAADCQTPGTPNDGTCGYLENACNSYNDCVNPFTPPGGGCNGKCGQFNVNGLGTCSCDAQCEISNDCCDDKITFCGCDTNLP